MCLYRILPKAMGYSSRICCGNPENPRERKRKMSKLFTINRNSDLIVRKFILILKRTDNIILIASRNGDSSGRPSFCEE